MSVTKLYKTITLSPDHANTVFMGLQERRYMVARTLEGVSFGGTRDYWLAELEYVNDVMALLDAAQWGPKP